MSHSRPPGARSLRRACKLLVFILVHALLAAIPPAVLGNPGTPSAIRPELMVPTGHVESITGIGVSADGRRVATNSGDGTIKIWDSATGRLDQTIITGGRARHEARCPVSFTPDGRRVVARVLGPAVAIFDLATGLRTTTVRGAADTFALDPRGRLLAVGTSQGLELFDMAGRNPIPLTLPPARQGVDKNGKPQANLLRGTTPWVKSLAFSADGQTLVIGGNPMAGNPMGGKAPKQVQAWQVDTWTLKGETNFSTEEAYVASSPDGNHVAVVAAQVVSLWDVATNTRRTVPTLGLSTRYSVSFDPSGKWVAVGGVALQQQEAGVHFVDWVSGSVTVAVQTRYPVCSVAFFPDGNHLATGDAAGRGVVWSVGTHVEPRVSLAGRVHLMQCVRFLDRGRRMITAGFDRAVKTWDCVAGKPLSTVIRLPWDGELYHRYTRTASSSDGRLIVTGDWDGTVCAWETASGKKLWSTFLKGRRFRLQVCAIGCSPDGRNVVAANESGVIGVFEAATGKERFTAQPGDSAVATLAFTPDNRTLATGRLDGTIDQWDISHLKISHVIARVAPVPASRYRAVLALAFSVDSRHLAAATSSGEVYIWETEGDRPPELFGATTPKAGTSGPGRPTSSPTGKAAPDGEPAIECATFSPDGRLFATGNDSGTIRLWDVRTRTLRSSIVAPHPLPVADLTFTPDGRFLASANCDGTVRMFETATSRLLATLVELHDDATFARTSGSVAIDLATDVGTSKDWVVTTPDGLFDGSPAGQRLVEWRIGDKYFSVEQFFNDFYTPGLLGRILNPPKAAEALAPQVALADLPVPPRVEIVSPTGGDRIKDDTLGVRVKITDQGGGTANPSLYLNGHRLADGSRQVAADGALTWSIKLVPGENRLRATGYNKQGNVESRGDEILVHCDAPATVTRPTLHVIAVGVDHYQAGMSLAFARADAQAIARFFKPGLFGQVKTHVLLDEKATRQGILTALDEVAKASSPQDAVILYLAGHGTLVGQLFYFLPHDARVNTDEEVRASSLSSVDIGSALTRITATKQLLVLDACHSGASTPSVGRILANRDSIAEIRAVQRLSRSSGTFLIAASKAEQYAKEIPELGHGVLTYAILSALGERGKAAALPNSESQVTVNSLLRYLSDEVPLLTDRYQRGERQEIVQASTGQDFPLVIVISRP